MRSFLIASRAALFIRKGVVATATAGTLVIMTALVIAFTGQAMAQKPSDAQLEDALWYCLRSKFPEIQREVHTAYDPPSGRNFAWDSDKQAWIDTKTLESICPKTSTDASMEDALWYCLRSKFPEIQRTTHEAFDPPSGRNFAWDSDKQAWIDTKTLECICPKCPPPRVTTTPAPPSKKEMRKEENKKEKEKKEVEEEVK